VDELQKMKPNGFAWKKNISYKKEWTKARMNKV
jgi:hypothetical protein